MASGCYRIPNVRVETHGGVHQHAVDRPISRRRSARVGAGDRARHRLPGRELGMDPIELRRKNFIQPEDFPYTTATGAEYDSGDYGRAPRQSADAGQLPRLVEQRDAARARGELVGIGISTFVEPSGSVGGETGLVRVEAIGRGDAGHRLAQPRSGTRDFVCPGHLRPDAGAHGSGAGGARRYGGDRTRGRHVRQPKHVAGRQRGDLDAATRSSTKRAASPPISSKRRSTMSSSVDGRLCASPARRPNVCPGRRSRRWRMRPGNQLDGEEPGLEANELFDSGDMWPFGTHLAVVRIDRDTGHVKSSRSWPSTTAATSSIR